LIKTAAQRQAKRQVATATDEKGTPKKKGRNLAPRRRALPYRINWYKVRLPVLGPEEWYFSLAVSDDWENVETAGIDHVEWLQEQSQEENNPDAWKYAEWVWGLWGAKRVDAGHALAASFSSAVTNNPHPCPPQGEGGFFSRRPNRGVMVRHEPQLAGALCPWPGTRTAFTFARPKTYPRTRRHLAAEIRGPCCASSRDFVAADNSSTSHGPHAKGQFHHHELRTSYHVPTTGVHAVREADVSLPLTGPPQAASYRLQAC